MEELVYMCKRGMITSTESIMIHKILFPIRDSLLFFVYDSDTHMVSMYFTDGSWYRCNINAHTGISRYKPRKPSIKTTSFFPHRTHTKRNRDN